MCARVMEVERASMNAPWVYVLLPLSFNIADDNLLFFPFISYTSLQLKDTIVVCYVHRRVCLVQSTRAE